MWKSRLKKLQRMRTTGDAYVPYVMATGNNMIDQFKPWYFGIAFAFAFKYCTGMPDMHQFAEKQRYRRGANAPRIEPPHWVQVMSRRIEAQLQRDWHFGFVSWNYLFRSTINLSKTLYSYGAFTAQEFQEGAISLCKAVHSSYTDMDGKKRGVQGDITKIKYVPGLKPAAKNLLQNLEHTSRKIPGTQEVRRVMRFEIQAYRIRYGVPIFVTFSPDEAHNMLMVRLSRTRRKDPVFSNGRDEVGKKLSGRGVPKLSKVREGEDVHLEIPIDDLASWIPNYEDRRIALARDSLASVDGFRILVHAAHKYLFGLNYCWMCPDCNADAAEQSCQDICGNSSIQEGGIFGRAEAAYTCIECQKSTGSLHAHSQVFIQCLHQHTPLSDVLKKMKGAAATEINKYLKYKAHVCRQVYANAELANERLLEKEASWPEYQDSCALISRPEYLTRRDNTFEVGPASSAGLNSIYLHHFLNCNETTHLGWFRPALLVRFLIHLYQFLNCNETTHLGWFRPALLVRFLIHLTNF